MKSKFIQSSSNSSRQVKDLKISNLFVLRFSLFMEKSLFYQNNNLNIILKWVRAFLIKKQILTLLLEKSGNTIIFFVESINNN